MGTPSGAMQPQGSGSNVNNRSKINQQEEGKPNTRTKKAKPQWPTNPTENKYNEKPTAGYMGMTQATRIHQIHDHERCLGTKRMICAANQWGDHETISHVYRRKDEREAGEMIRNIVL